MEERSQVLPRAIQFARPAIDRSLTAVSEVRRKILRAQEIRNNSGGCRVIQSVLKVNYPGRVLAHFHLGTRRGAFLLPAVLAR
jgi:hypothetical protein